MSHAHISPKPVSIRLLSRKIDRMILHFRDPRQAMLSWTHNLNRLWREYQSGNEETLDRILWPAAVPTEAYFEQGLNDQITWQIEHYFPLCVEWINSWLSLIDSGPPIRILLTHFEQMVENQEAFFDRVLEFYEIP